MSSNDLFSASKKSGGSKPPSSLDFYTNKNELLEKYVTLIKVEL